MNQHTKIFFSCVSRSLTTASHHSFSYKTSKQTLANSSARQLYHHHLWHHSEVPTSTIQKKIFEISNAAATHNNYILQSHNFDMTRTIAANHNSHISYRSEFRTVEVLEPLLQKIPLWKSVSEILFKGAKYPLERINSSRQKSDLEESLQWWNHQSAKKDPSILTKLIQKDVNAGFQLPTTTNSLHKMPHTCIAP